MTCFLHVGERIEETYATFKTILGFGVLSLLDKLTTTSVILGPGDFQGKFLLIKKRKKSNLDLSAI